MTLTKEEVESYRPEYPELCDSWLAMHKMLEELEWAGRNGDYCVVCLAMLEQGHAADCKLKGLLG